MADLETIVAYLLGEGELDGKWFGDPDVPLVAGKYKARYWWRSQLREAWNTRHGAGDADRSAELTTAWMAGVERERQRAEEDSARLDWLERHLVEVREPLRYGSAHMFYAIQTNDEGEPYLSDLRARVDAARAGERG